MSASTNDSNTTTGNKQAGAIAQGLRKRNAEPFHNWGANITVIPYGDKAPDHAWKSWLTERQTATDFDGLPWHRAGAFGIINGYNGWRSVDFDANKNEGAIPYAVVQTFLAALGLPADYPWVERSQSGRGWHVWLLCPEEFPSDFTNHGEKGVYVGKSRDGSFNQLELRWANTQTVVSASIDSALWANGYPDSKPTTVTVDAVIAGFMAVAQAEPPQAAPSRVVGAGTNTDLPGDDFNEHGDVVTLLKQHGWQHVGTRTEGGREISDWRKPGSTSSHAHATLNFYPGMFYVFSSDAEPFKQNTPYSPFGVYAFLKHGGDFKAAAADLRQQGFGKPANPALLTQGHAETSYAERLALLYGDRIRYVTEYGRWAVYDGQRWNLDTSADSVTLQGLTKNALDETYAASWLIKAATVQERDQKQQEWRSEVVKKQNKRAIDGIISLTRSEPGIAIKAGSLDANPYLLNVQNGTVNLETGELQPYDPNDLITKLAPVTFKEDAECPKWLAFLDRIMAGNTELIGYLQRLAGYALAGTGREQSLSIFYGSGANGKSTFLETLAAIMGDYQTKTPTQTLMRRNQEGIRNDLAALKGARFVTANEMPQGGRLDVPTVKDLTGEDTISARFLHAEYFQFRPVFTLVIYGNHKPVIDGDDDGIWRRVHLVPFTEQIPEHERNKQLREQLIQEEASGILNWALAGFREWNETGLNPPESITAATEEYREEMDATARFIEQCFDFTANGELRTKDIMAVYEKWFEEEEGERRGQKKSATALGEALTKKGIGKRKSNGVIYRTGIQLSEEGHRIKRRQAPLMAAEARAYE